MGPGSGLWMILDCEDWLLSVTQPFNRSIVEIHVRHLELGRPGNRAILTGNRESMILRGDEHASGRHLLHGMISAAMTVRHLHCVTAIRETQDLMPQADTE